MIPEFFSDMPALQQGFWYLAFFASSIFIFQTIMTFLGTDGSADLDADFDGDFHNVEAPFELFSFRNLINFLLGFGWTGVAFYGKMNEAILVIVAFAVGIIFVGIFFFIIKQILKLQEDNTFDINNTLGKTAEVYMTIPAHKLGSGKVQVSVKGSVHELEAVTEQEKKIYAGNKVRITRVENQVLFVEKI
ncbi:NfeD family protein [Kaistella antarctica]|uniref:Uncharacterized protein n=1 Tax=Kaistella antarctica TaxID=266748 RepID=A0A3S4UW13_9FLAO|nr:NfeD family protein [Kaistella antarctica]SEW09484.1 NfeD-like C-terminal, partner-binding [Kaistella antarctica]VEH96861.1 Uncharacterised protein [Kaistella antarctica]